MGGSSIGLYEHRVSRLVGPFFHAVWVHLNSAETFRKSLDRVELQAERHGRLRDV